MLYCLTPFLAAIPPWGAMSRARWTKILKGDQERTNRALSLCGVLDECMWVIGNPLASTLAVISGLLAFSFTGMCVVVGALMFLTELTTEPPSQTQLARAEGISRKEYREREAARAEALKVETAAEETRRRLEREGVIGAAGKLFDHLISIHVLPVEQLEHEHRRTAREQTFVDRHTYAS